MEITVIKGLKFRLFQKKVLKEDEFSVNDLKIRVIYAPFKLCKKLKKSIFEMISSSKTVISEDFAEFNKTSFSGNLIDYMPGKTLRKITSRHGLNPDEENLGVVAEILNEKNENILKELANEVRFMTIYTLLPRENFDFLQESTGISPKIVKNLNSTEKISVFLGEDFLIKCLPSGKTYYDILPAIPKALQEYNFLPVNRIFSEYIKGNVHRRQNVKIRELMSK